MRLMNQKSNTSQIICNRPTPAYYCNSDGVLTLSEPYQPRPKYVYNPDTSKWDFKGFLDEQSLTELSPRTYEEYYSSLVNSINSSGGWTAEDVTMLGPNNKNMTVIKITVPSPTSTEWKIPVSYSLDRMPSAGSPCWSFFIKKGDIPAGLVLQLGVPGQSLQPFDMNTLNWTTSVLQNLKNDPTTSWFINAGREVYTNGWVRMGIGGYCWAGGYFYNASFDIGTVVNSSFTGPITFYMCNFNATYEPSVNMLSSYIDMGKTRDSDSFKTQAYTTNTNNTQTSYINQSGMLVIAPPHTARPNYSYNSSSSTWVQNGYISESSLLNKAVNFTDDIKLYSSTLTQTTETTDPTGGNDAYKITFNGGQTSSIQTYNNEYLHGPATYSIFVKPVTTGTQITLAWFNVCSRTFDFDSGAWTDAYSDSSNYYGDINPVKLANGWWRLALGMQVPGDMRNTTSGCYMKTAGAMYLYYHNVSNEPLHTLSSYIPYKGTRAADNLINVPSITYDFTQPSYTIRNSIATFFNSTGNLVEARPYQIRPNYTYSSSTWTQNGYLIETTPATNFLTSMTYKNGAHGTATTLAPELLNGQQVLQTLSDETCDGGFKYTTIDNQSYIASIFIHRPTTTAQKIDAWWSGSGPDSAYYSVTSDRIMNNGNTQANATSATWKLTSTTYGDWTRISMYCPVANASHISVWEPCFIPRNGYAIWTCPMIESYTGSYYPSSFIPMGMTRAADN